jgi:hypothetical protein
MIPLSNDYKQLQPEVNVSQSILVDSKNENLLITERDYYAQVIILLSTYDCIHWM